MKDWLRLRPYIHISPRFNKKNKNKAKHYIASYVLIEKIIAKHRFSPLLHYKIVDHRYKRDKTKVLADGKIGRSYKVKPRPIFYPNHLDAQIFAYYSHLIGQRLESIYKSNTTLNNSVIGYRAIEYNKNRNKCTIDFAKEVFNFVSTSKIEDISVICLDVASFFDNLDHDYLKQSWKDLFGTPMLDVHHYKVFRAVTNPTYVDLEELIPLIPNFDKTKINLLSKSKYNSLFQSYSQFRSVIYSNKLLRKYNSNSSKKGIPQGTPISATLSNLYFLGADIEITKIVEGLNGLYRRYSDDILIVCPSENAKDVEERIKNIIDKELNLSIQENKTTIANLKRDNPESNWNIEVFDSQNIRIQKTISYLGFDFDGANIRIRNSSLSKYYRSLKKAIRRRAFYAKVQVIKNKTLEIKKDAWIFRAGIFRKKTHLGAARKKISGKKFWGNYISYVQNAAQIMADISSSAIKKQIRNHWKIVAREVEKFEKLYNLPKAPKTKSKQ